MPTSSRKIRTNGFSYPLSVQQVFSLILITLTSLYFFFFLDPLASIFIIGDNTYYITVLFSISLFVVIVSSIICQGIDPRDSEIDRRDNANIVAVYCHICEKQYSKSTKHCLNCNKCVYKFDHHCECLIYTIT